MKRKHQPIKKEVNLNGIASTTVFCGNNWMLTLLLVFRNVGLIDRGVVVIEASRMFLAY